MNNLKYYASYLLLIPLVLALAPFAESPLELKEAMLQVVQDHKRAYLKI